MLANPPYLSGFLFSGMLRVAPYCVPGGVRVVSYHPRIHLRLRVPSCWFYDLLRKALKSPNAILAVMQVVWQLQLNGCP
jgi:hypothetical protein